MKIYESGENYLEVMYVLNSEKGYVRSVDVAEKLQFSKPSVSRAVSILKKADLVVIDANGFIKLTEQGRQLAKKIYERHCFLIRCFKFLGVTDEVAKKDACKIEHVISEETFEKFKQYFNKIF